MKSSTLKLPVRRSEPTEPVGLKASELGTPATPPQIAAPSEFSIAMMTLAHPRSFDGQKKAS